MPSFSFRFSSLMLGALCACTLAVPLKAAAQPSQSLPGYDRFDVQTAHRAFPVQGSIWYPAANRTYRGMIGDNIVFRGTPVQMGPRVKEGRHPLVVLSHGSGGNMDGLGWLSSALVKAGYMVLAVNHPGSTSGDSSPRRSVRLGQRVKDLSSALDQVLADPYFASHVDTNRIVSLGFSLGGATALQSVGLRFDSALTKAFCDENPDRVGCDFYRKGGVDFSKVDPEQFEGDFKDPRFAATVAVDPGFTVGLDPESLNTVTAPVLLISLGFQNDNWKAVDVTEEGSGLAHLLPKAQLVRIDPANHFSFLAECKPAGKAILAEEGEDPICDDPEGGDRGIAHQQTINAVLEFLKQL